VFIVDKYSVVVVVYCAGDKLTGGCCEGNGGCDEIYESGEGLVTILSLFSTS